MSNPTIYAVLVTYGMRQKLDALMETLLPQLTRLIIIDNGSPPETVTTLKTLAAQHNQIELLLNLENLGLATAQNQGIRRALAQKAEWVLLLDDDSVPAPDMLQKMLAAAPATPAILAPQIVEQNTNTPTRYLIAHNRWHLARKPLNTSETLEALSVIASGSLISARVFEQIGLMRDGFFIDAIDHDFCLRARAANIPIRVIGSATLAHQQGNKSTHHLFGKTLVTANYGPTRRYYIFRNRFFLLRLHGGRWPGLIPHQLLSASWDLARILLLEPKKTAKLKASLRGMAHGLLHTVPTPSTLQE